MPHRTCWLTAHAARIHFSCTYPARYRTDTTVTAGAELQLHLRAATKAMAETKARAMRAKTWMRGLNPQAAKGRQLTMHRLNCAPATDGLSRLDAPCFGAPATRLPQPRLDAPEPP